MPPKLHLGLDLGTSGARGCLVDAAGRQVAEASTPLPPSTGENGRREQHPEDWWHATVTVIRELAARSEPASISALAIDGTSGTVLLCDRQGRPLSPGVMYNDRRATAEAAEIGACAPAESAAHGAGSGLAKWLWLERHHDTAGARWVLNQADWIVGRLTGRWGASDENNVLKLGWDPLARRWPAWLERLALPTQRLPAPFAPGTPIAPLLPEMADTLGLPRTTALHAGTTDSTAAFLATGCTRPGEAMTALGSTLVVKLLSERPVFAPAYGVYSHRLGDCWLVGGGSNSGGAALKQHFSVAQMETLTPHLHPDRPTGLDYYPLTAPGERFPVNDPYLPPRMEPRPADDAEFLQGLLEGITAIEARAYRLLEELGAPPVVSVRTTGGGAANPAWRAIRQRLLGVPLLEPLSQEACYGTALLALARNDQAFPSRSSTCATAAKSLSPRPSASPC
ncbi:FGGY-family carbohydrate kinase [Endothiovibrio diazotrophicus]